MDAPPPPAARPSRLLPYWAVFRTDVRQTTRSWAYRLGVLAAVAAAGGSVAYQVGVHREAGIVQSAAAHGGDLLRGLAAGGLGVVAVLAVSAVGGERATVADGVLCRGLSRRQYYLAKWHARVAVVAGTAALLAAAVVAAHHYLLDPDVTAAGGLAAVAVLAALLAAVVSCGVAVGALADGTAVGVAVFWLLLCGGWAAAAVLPDAGVAPDRLTAQLGAMLRGRFDPGLVGRAVAAAAGVSGLAAAVGMVGFDRKDI